MNEKLNSNLVSCGEDNYYGIVIEKPDSKMLAEMCHNLRKKPAAEDAVTDGLKHDGGKARLDLVPPEIIEAVGEVMTFGAQKYGENSYKQVAEKSTRS